jgi:phage tail-like protein
MRRKYVWPVVVVCAGVLISGALVTDTRLWGQYGDPAAVVAESSDSFVFRLELNGDKVADYNECFGLGSRNDIEETDIGAGSVIVRQKTPGALEWQAITLRRVGPSSEQLWSWRRMMEDGHLKDAMRNGAILMVRAGSQETVARWNFTNGWPASLTIEGSTEELTIVHEGLTRVGTTPTTSGGATRSRTS